MSEPVGGPDWARPRLASGHLGLVDRWTSHGASVIAIEDLAAEIAARAASRAPFLIGITGSVASGKSTLAAQLAAALALLDPPLPTEIAASDGFLLPNRALDARGLLSRKGRPETYDAKAMSALIAAAREGAVDLPVYSHRLYDIEPGAVRRLSAAGAIRHEGLGVNALPTGAFDVMIFIDAAEDDLETWFVGRFLEYVVAGRKDPESFYARFADLDEAAARAFAGEVWRGINLPNLRESIAPLKDKADLVVFKRADHAIIEARWREKAGR